MTVRSAVLGRNGQRYTVQLLKAGSRLRIIAGTTLPAGRYRIMGTKTRITVQ